MDNSKFNGYIFKRVGGLEFPGHENEKRYIPKVCRAMPLYPKTYGLSCHRLDCHHCHPETAGRCNRPSTWEMRNNGDSQRGYFYNGGYPADRPSTCVVGRRGCKPHRMIRIRPPKAEAVVSKDETRRRAARSERAVEEEKDENKRDKTQRLSKWETSTVRRIDDGFELAMLKDAVPSTDDWKIQEAEDIELAILASLGLLDDYEAGDANISLNSLPRNEDLYTIRYKPSKKNPNRHRAADEGNTPVLAEDIDWELVLDSRSEGSMSWIEVEE
jgi:hypothetical protein